MDRKRKYNSRKFNKAVKCLYRYYNSQMQPLEFYELMRIYGRPFVYSALRKHGYYWSGNSWWAVR